MSTGVAADAFYALASDEQVDRLAGLARAALAAWGLPDDADLELVAERENAVFRVQVDDGTFALRVHRAGYHDDAQLRSQVAWARALARDGVVETAEVVDTMAGEPFTVASHPEVPEPRQVSLLRWVDGELLSDAGRPDDATFELVGELMAGLHDHAARWRPPAGFAALRWDVEGLIGEDPEWGRFWEADGLDEDDRAAMAEFRARARRELTAWGEDPDRFSLVHGDFLPENLLLRRDGITVLDFDDTGYSWHLFDIATALAMPYLDERFEELRDAFVRGYRQVRPLPDEHVERLPLFFTLRYATYAGWMHTRAHTEFARAVGPAVIRGAAGAVREYLAT